ncbi:unnamed protein product [Parajaminaea phylloscopi]
MKHSDPTLKRSYQAHLDPHLHVRARSMEVVGSPPTLTAEGAAAATATFAKQAKKKNEKAPQGAVGTSRSRPRKVVQQQLEQHHHHHHLSSSLKLQDIFFDLVVTANIDVYSGSDSLSTAKQVGGFLAYVGLLWWMWYSQILFDVRFRNDQRWLVDDDNEDSAAPVQGKDVEGSNVGSGKSPASIDQSSPLRSAGKSTLDTESDDDDDDDDDGQERVAAVKRRMRVTVVMALQLLLRLAQTAVWFGLTSAPGQFGRGDYHTFAFICGIARYTLAADYALVLGARLYLSLAAVSAQQLAQTQEGAPALANKTEEQEAVATSTPTPTSALSRLWSAPLWDPSADSMTRRSSMHPSLGLASLSGPVPRWLRDCCVLFVLVLSKAVSGTLWLVSSFIHTRRSGLDKTDLALWLCAIGLEVASLIVVEVQSSGSATLPSLARTDICERLALFALVVLGGGLTGLGEVLNSLAPGFKVPARDDPSVMVDAGGWGAATVVQAVTTVLTVCLAFTTYYRDAAEEMPRRTSLAIFGWGALHVIYHCSAMILVVGLKKLLSFQNSLTALRRFLSSPRHYLPTTAEYGNMTTRHGITALVSRLGDADDVRHMDLSTAQAGVVAVIAAIEGFGGASIPSPETAVALLRSTVPLLNATLGPGLSDQLGTYGDFVSGLGSADSLASFIGSALFQYRYIYLACAAIYASNCLIKGVQTTSRQRRALTRKLSSLLVRLATAMILAAVQATYFVYSDLPS